MDIQLRFSKVFMSSVPVDAGVEGRILPAIPDSLVTAAEGRKREFVAGRYCALRAAELLGVELGALGIGENREPLWPEQLIGSISHTKSRALAAVAFRKQVKYLGVDLESIIDLKRVDTVQTMVATESDLVLLNQFPAQSKLTNLTILFSAKEALYKALYPACQCYIGFQEAELVHLDHSARTFALALRSQTQELLAFNGVYPGQFWIESETVATAIEL